jgi:hypothetical protein
MELVEDVNEACLHCGDVIILGKVQELLNDILNDPFLLFLCLCG